MGLALAVEIEGGTDLRIGAGEINFQVRSIDGDGNAEFDRNFGGHIIVQVICEFINPVGHVLDHGPGPALRIIQGVFYGRLQDLAAVAGEQLSDTRFAQADGADHGPDISPIVLGHPAIGKENPQKFLVQLAALIELYGRYAHAFLEHFIAGRREGAGHLAPHIR